MEANKIIKLDGGKRVAINKGCLGWSFSVYYGGATYASFTSASYKLKKEIEQQLKRFIDTGKFDWYGTAEV